jgi:hypothetical protein
MQVIVKMAKIAEPGETFLVHEGSSKKRPLSKIIESRSSTRTVM